MHATELLISTNFLLLPSGKRGGEKKFPTRAMVRSWLISLVGIFNNSPEIFLATSCFLFFFLYFQFKRSSLRPTNWPVVGMLPSVLVNVQHVHNWATDVLKETGCTFQFYGPWFFGMSYLATCDPANVNHVFNANFSNYPKGDEFTEIFDVLGDGIFTADDESWRSQRKKAHSLMSHPKFRSFVAKSSYDKVKSGLIPLMNQLAEQQTVVDLQDVFLRLTFDMTCTLVFGVDPICLSAKFPTIPFAQAMDDAMEALLFRHAVPISWWRLMRWLRIGTERKLDAARGVIDHFIAESIATKRKVKDCMDDLLTSYINDPSSDCNDNFLRDSTVNLMLAGRDTTGVALSWFFWLLSKYPRVQFKILEELRDQVVGKKELILDHPIVFSGEELSKLVYLHASLCESLRLFPPVPFEHKGVLQPDVLPSGQRVSSETKILFSTYSMARMEGIWGKDCLEFRPERWISENGRIRHEPSYKFLSFNCGPRTCLGKEVAFTQLKTVAAAMVCNFEVDVMEDPLVEPKPSIILYMKNGLNVRIRKSSQLMKYVENINKDKYRN